MSQKQSAAGPSQGTTAPLGGSAVHAVTSVGALLPHRLRQFTLGVPGGHDLQVVALDLATLAFATKLQVALLGNSLGGLAGGFEPLAGVKLFGVLGQELSYRAGHGQSNIGVDVDLAHAVLDGFLNFFDRHTVGFLHLAAELVDDGQQVLRNGR